MADQDLLYSFTSHIAGKNAKVAIYRDRIEWDRPRGVSGVKMTAGLLTGGASFLATGFKGGKAGSEMIPVKNVSSVVTRRDGMLNTIVSVITSGNSIDFRVSHAEAKQIREILNSLILGDDTARAYAAASEPVTAAPLAGAAASAATAPAATEDISTALQQLAALHQAGILTDEEFATKKTELLARM
ncbi:SHOCT domain-containing protein [Curtobacterium sp. MCBD17_030]|uniref:SHOCT domain-containing protein n=1 Tax=Curtobacterium sp. MCBD17_030 TaxID=2175649 RepID=UPI000D9D41DB|nr:SHOCT domain-containing protein [Curtobacterium sp. MCBD17_030]PYY32772.1 hypothetical protein DEI89_11880 [Curtobacterium sp. MCBD17_030]